MEQGYYESRVKAKAALMAGLVIVDGERIEKSGMKVPRTASIVVKGAPHPYVSRGGLKLEKAIKQFGLELEGAVMLDIGASTGGLPIARFSTGRLTSMRLDVGYNQLDWSLRQDERVNVMERTNFRYTVPDDLKGPEPTFATIDVSFISLKLILPTLGTLLKQGAGIVALIKPQFEAGREKVGKSGVVREPATHREVLDRVLGFAASQGYDLQRLDFSPITGGEGNIEFLAYWHWEPGRKLPRRDAAISAIVEEAGSRSHICGVAGRIILS